jgi:hypothetical protein
LLLEGAGGGAMSDISGDWKWESLRTHGFSGGQTIWSPYRAGVALNPDIQHRKLIYQRGPESKLRSHHLPSEYLKDDFKCGDCIR